MRQFLFNTFAIDGIVIWLGLIVTLALMCIIGAVHQKARRLDWTLAFTVMVVQFVYCLICMGTYVVNMTKVYDGMALLYAEQLFVDLISLVLIVPVQLLFLDCARVYAIARFRDNKTVLFAGLVAGARIAEGVKSLKDELASIRRLEFYEEVEEK